MGMGLLLARLQAEGLADRVQVISTGVHALPGYSAAPISALLMAKRGFDLSGHLSAPLTRKIVEGASLLLVMEERQRETVLQISPEAAGRVMLWRELAGERADVPDPYAYGRAQYEETLAIMESALEAGWSALRARLGLDAPVDGKAA